MSVELRDRLSQAAGPTGSTPDVVAALRRGHTLRRRRRLRKSVGSLCLALLMVGGAVTVVQQSGGPELTPIGDGDDAAAVLQEPAASDPALWPLRVVYEMHYPEGYSASHDLGGVARYEFVGTSWSNWQVTQLAGSRIGEIVDYKVSAADRFVGDGTGGTRGPNGDFRSSWHEPGWSLQQIEVESVPASPDILERLNLSPADVYAFASSSVVGCDEPAIEDCPDMGQENVRALMHAESGLLLYRETAVEGEREFSYTVRALDVADPGAIPEHDESA